MQIVHFICDRCHRHEIEDDALDWKQTEDGRDLCPGCVFPFPRIPEPSMWEGSPIVVTGSNVREPDAGQPSDRSAPSA